MKFRSYKILHKKMSIDLNQSIYSTIIIYIIIYSLMWIGLLNWKTSTIIYLYTFFYILIFVLHLKAENVEGKGDHLLLKYLSYSPVDSSNVYFYSYIHRMWFNIFAILEILIPSFILYLFDTPIIEIVKFIIRIHILVLVIIYLRFTILWLKRKSNMKIYLKTLIILILVAVFLIPYNRNLTLTDNLIFYLDGLLLSIFVLSLLTYRHIFNELLHFKKSPVSNKVVIFTRIFSRFIFYPMKWLERLYNILSIKYTKLLRSGTVIDHYVTVIMLMLLFLYVTSFFTIRTGLQLVNTMSFILCLNVFHRIKCSQALDEVIASEYIPINDRIKQMIEDFFHFMNTFFIWILLILLLSIQQSVSIFNLFQGIILFICYFIITLLCKIPNQHPWYSEAMKEKVKKKIRRISFILTIFMVLLSFIFEHMIIHFPIVFLFIALILLFSYWVNINKNAEKKHISNATKETKSAIKVGRL